MQIIKADFENIKTKDNLTITIGNFDGLHKGHNLLVEEVLKYKDTKSAVLTFSPHTQVYFQGDKFKVLTKDNDKINVLNNYNLDYFFIINFTKAFASLEKKAFINFLKNLNVKRIILGLDAKFGKNGSINKTILEKHFEVIEMADYIENNIRISSTYIKELLSEGNILAANKYLNKNYKITGIVTHGNKVGTTLGYPTANIKYNNYFLPKTGVYFVKIGNYYGMANIGNNPSINYNEEKRLEVHIFDFNKKLYNEKIEIEFINYLRQEIKFKSKEDLITQLKIDEKIARSMI